MAEEDHASFRLRVRSLVKPLFGYIPSPLPPPAACSVGWRPAHDGSFEFKKFTVNRTRSKISTDPSGPASERTPP